MSSLQAKLANLFCRLTTKPASGLRTPPAKLRLLINRRMAPVSSKGVSIELVREPVIGAWHCPQKIEHEAVILYIHGGGYFFGSPHTHRALTFELARRSGARVFSLDYRLAPEHPFPAARDDVVAAYHWLREAQGIPAQNLIVMGDSAGGALTLSLLQHLKAEQNEQPACAILYSPLTDLSFSGDSFKTNKYREVMFKPAAYKLSAEYYAVGIDVQDPEVSPLFGRFDGLAPLQIHVSTWEVLYDDARRVAEAVELAGGSVELHEEKGLMHAWPTLYPYFPEASLTIDNSVQFLKQYWK